MSFEFLVPVGWTVTEARDYCVKVADGTHASPKQVVQGKRLVTSKNIVGGQLDLSNAYNISEEDFVETNRRSKVDKLDILFSMIGTVGQSCIVEEEPDFAIKNVGLLKNSDPYKAWWLYFYLRSPQAQQLVKERMRGTTQQYMPLGDIRHFPIIHPAGRDQLERAVGLLLPLYKRVNLNRQINQTLEQMAQALFQSWFVDFEPVKAKVAALADGRAPLRAAMSTLSGKTDAELDELPGAAFDTLAATAALFPEEMEESALSAVPKGWVIKRFSDTAQILGGGTPKTSMPSFWGGDIPWFSVVDAPTDYDVFTIDTEKKITQAGLDSSSARLLPEGTTIISARGTVGKLALTGVPMVINQSCYGLRGNEAGVFFNYFSVKSIVSALKQRTHGSVFDTITRETLSSVDVIAPPKAVLGVFEAKVEPLMHQIKANLKQVTTLAALRDSLLPKLLSGELAVTQEGGEPKEQGPEGCGDERAQDERPWD